MVLVESWRSFAAIAVLINPLQPSRTVGVPPAFDQRKKPSVGTELVVQFQLVGSYIWSNMRAPPKVLSQSLEQNTRWTSDLILSRFAIASEQNPDYASDTGKLNGPGRPTRMYGEWYQRQYHTPLDRSGSSWFIST